MSLLFEPLIWGSLFYQQLNAIPDTEIIDGSRILIFIQKESVHAIRGGAERRGRERILSSLHTGHGARSHDPEIMT